MGERIKEGTVPEARKPQFNFIARIDDQDFYFTEISGLGSEHQLIDFRGNEPRFSGDLNSIPGRKDGTVTLKRGVFKGKKDDWIKMASRGLNVRKEDVVISLLNEEGNIVRKWKIYNAFPVKVQSSDLKADGNEVAVETLELSHEGISVEE
ncbi:phage tail protein [Pollutibacter soli]|uniref:phage tail protein n=1 Tax=Pollutibacter soli TaxID=3034157 RepID=UPI00301376BB